MQTRLNVNSRNEMCLYWICTFTVIKCTVAHPTENNHTQNENFLIHLKTSYEEYTLFFLCANIRLILTKLWKIIFTFWCTRWLFEGMLAWKLPLTRMNHRFMYCSWDCFLQYLNLYALRRIFFSLFCYIVFFCFHFGFQFFIIFLP